MKLDELPMWAWKPLMKVAFVLYFKLRVKPAGKLWRAL